MVPFLPGGSAPTALPKTLADLEDELLPLLGASSSADLSFWTIAELTQWANEGLKRLARRIGLFVERDTSIAVLAGTAEYTLPTRHLSTIHVSLGGALLRPANVPEIQALDTSWENSSGTPSKYLQDQGTGVEKIRLYKQPIAGGTLAVAYHQFPDELSAATALPCPEPVADYLLFYGLGEARRKESDGAMPEIASHCEEMTAFYEKLFGEYWGGVE